MNETARNIGHWMYVNSLPILAMAVFVVVSFNVAHRIEQEFSVSFTYAETDVIAGKWEDDAERVQDFAQQLSFLANFIRLEFKTPINFSQRIVIDVSRKELAAGAALSVEAASKPADGRITADGIVNFSSEEVTLCNLSILNEPFAITELKTRVRTLSEELLPRCVDTYFAKNQLGMTRRDGAGAIVSVISVSPDSLSKTAIRTVSLLLVASLILVLLKVFKSFRQLFSLKP